MSDTVPSPNELARLLRKDFIRDFEQLLSMYGAQIEIQDNDIQIILEDNQRIYYFKEVAVQVCN